MTSADDGTVEEPDNTTETGENDGGNTNQGGSQNQGGGSQSGGGSNNDDDLGDGD